MTAVGGTLDGRAAVRDGLDGRLGQDEAGAVVSGSTLACGRSYSSRPVVSLARARTDSQAGGGSERRILVCGWKLFPATRVPRRAHRLAAPEQGLRVRSSDPVGLT